MGRTVPYYQLHICMIAHAQNKRRGQTKVFPLLLIPLLFLAAVHRFLSESCTDMPLLLAYVVVDVSVLHTVGESYDAKDLVRHNVFLRRTPSDSLRSPSPPSRGRKGVHRNPSFALLHSPNVLKRRTSTLSYASNKPMSV